MIFAIRFVTATCLFLLLGKANIWLSPLNNIILAMGYRFFLLLSPLLNRVCGRFSVSTALVLAALGICLFCFQKESILVLGAVLTGIGLSVSGFLIKAKAAETSSGVAHNKIALNSGSFVAGLVLLFTFNSKQIFFGGCAVVIIFTALGAYITSKKEVKYNDNVSLSNPDVFNKRHFFAWLLIGVAVGIKLFGVFSVLPQYLIDKKGILPNWYGLMILLNSFVVIIFQLPIIHWIERRSDTYKSFKAVIFVMILGMLIISCPRYFYVEYFLGSFLWILLLSFVECFASYLDMLGAKAQFLLVKETAVGLGAGLTVFLSRELSSPFSSVSIGFIGIAAILLAAVLLKKEQKTTLNYDKISNMNWGGELT